MIKKSYLTKKQALEMYLEGIGKSLSSDRIKERMAWLDFTDYLYKNGQITLRSWNYWTVPKEVMKNCR